MKKYLLLVLVLFVSGCAKNSYDSSVDTISSIKQGAYVPESQLVLFNISVTDSFYNNLFNKLEDASLSGLEIPKIMLCFNGQNEIGDTEMPLKCQFQDVNYKENNNQIYAVSLPLSDSSLDGIGYMYATGDSMKQSNILRFFHFKEPIYLSSVAKEQITYYGHIDIDVSENLETEQPLLKVKHSDNFKQLKFSLGDLASSKYQFLNKSSLFKGIEEKNKGAEVEDRVQTIETRIVVIPVSK